ncbi:hypothetical protein [Nocardia sp. NPDC051570]|uniref:hypothetical protein n=1 Tax=Nocardia sp. NPDC051570 TaxID=3364324 RepID=UPI00378E7F49
MVAEQRGRELVLHSLTRAIPAGERTALRGLCVTTASTDFLFFQDRTIVPHRDHIIVHELAHFLCGHTIRVLETPPEYLTDGRLGPVGVRDMLGPTNYTTIQEREAEMLASLILAQGANPIPRPSAGTLGRLETAMGYRRRPAWEF